MDLMIELRLVIFWRINWEMMHTELHYLAFARRSGFRSVGLTNPLKTSHVPSELTLPVDPSDGNTRWQCCI